jgi:Fe(3+) dicitrate transport protein
VSTAAQYWQDSNLPVGAANTYVPAKIPAYTLADLSSEWQVNHDLTLLAGISNLGDRRYYSRVWQTGLEPAVGRSVYVGFKLGM